MWVANTFDVVFMKLAQPQEFIIGAMVTHADPE